MAGKCRSIHLLIVERERHHELVTMLEFHHLEIDGIFFFNDTTTTEIYTLSLHDALPILRAAPVHVPRRGRAGAADLDAGARADRKSTRLNSSHVEISYAVFCLKKKIHRRVDFSQYSTE